MMKYSLIFVFVSFVQVFASAQTADEYFNSGIAKFDQHNYPGALTEFDKSIELNPNSSLTYNNRGIIKNILNDTIGAVSDYDKAIALEPNNYSAFKNRALLEMRLKKYSLALADFNKVLEFDPTDEAALKNVKLLNGVGVVQVAQSKKETVVGQQKKDTVHTPISLVKPIKEKLRENTVKTIKAEESKSDATINSPSQTKQQKNHLPADDYVRRGQSRVKAFDYSGAYENYTKAIEVDSTNASAYYYRGLLKAMLRDYKGELKEEENMSFEKKKEEAQIKRELFKGDFGAIEDYTKAINLNPIYADAYYSRAMSFYNLEEYRNAIANYTEVITLKKDFADAYYYRGMAKAILLDMNSSCMDFRKAAEFGNIEAKDLLTDCK